MKKLLLLVLTLVLITACQEQRYFTESPEIDAVKSGISLYENGDWDAWKAQFADTAKIYHNSVKGITPEESMNAHKNMISNFSSYGFEDEGSFIEMVIDNDEETWVNYWANWKGTLKANGKEISVPVHLTMQYKDGKILEEYGYYDTSPISTALAEIEKANNMPVEEKTIDAAIDKLVNEFHNKQNTAILGEFMADNYVRYMNDVKVAENPKELTDGMNVFFTGFPDFHIKLLHKSPIFNNTRFVHWEMTGTNTGEFDGSPATGKKVKITGLSRIHFNGQGKIDEENVFYDQLSLMQQLGRTLN